MQKHAYNTNLFLSQRYMFKDGTRFLLVHIFCVCFLPSVKLLKPLMDDTFLPVMAHRPMTFK